jgi:hypothetical protein
MSKLLKLKEKLASLLTEIKLAVVKTNNGVLEYDGDEDLVAGMNVYVTNEETNERVAAADGEYTTEDNKVITVKDGKVESIVDPVAEVDAEAEVAPEGDEPKNEETTSDTTETVETPAPVEAEDEPTEIAKIREEINELYKLVDSILDKIGESRAEADERLKKLECMSAAKPADEAFETIVEKTNNFSDDRLNKLSQDWRK